jgi:signal transduction histidine kinase
MAKILVIEDERLLREDIVDTLSLSSFDVISAPNGETGLAMAREHMPDVILCDIRMPGVNGYQVLEELRTNSNTAPIPFIFLTAQADRESMRSGMRLGADDFVTKPFSAEELISAVEARLERRNMFVRDAESKLEQAKLRLTRMITHELKTPLVSMNSVLDIVARRMDRLGQTDLGDMLSTIDAGGKRLNHLVEQMVLVTQLESGLLQRATLPQRGSLTEYGQLLSSALTLGKRFAGGRHDVRIHADPFDATVNVLCYPQALKHAIAELIANAINFSPENASVRLSGWRAGRAMWVTITDQGCGMTREQIAMAMQSFTQIDRDVNEQQGMGMGLMVAYQIITLHGGVLEIISEVGKGTQIQIGMPIIE